MNIERKSNLICLNTIHYSFVKGEFCNFSVEPKAVLIMLQ